MHISYDARAMEAKRERAWRENNRLMCKSPKAPNRFLFLVLMTHCATLLVASLLLPY